MAEQVNVFVENRPGRLAAVTRALADRGVNIRAVVVQDHGDYGLLKMLVTDPAAACEALAAHGFAAKRKPILAVCVEDRPGGFARLAEVFGSGAVNLLNAYGFVVNSGTTAVCCVEVPDADAARATAEAGGFHVLPDEELYNL